MNFFAYISFVVGVSLADATPFFVGGGNTRRVSSSGGIPEVWGQGVEGKPDEALHSSERGDQHINHGLDKNGQSTSIASSIGGSLVDQVSHLHASTNGDPNRHSSPGLHRSGSPHAHGDNHDERGNQHINHGFDKNGQSTSIASSIGGSLVDQDSHLHASTNGDPNRHSSAGHHRNGSPLAHGHNHDERGNQHINHGFEKNGQSAAIASSIGGSPVDEDSHLHASTNGDYNRKHSHSHSSGVSHSHSGVGNQEVRFGEELEHPLGSDLNGKSSGVDEDHGAAKLVTKPLVKVRHSNAHYGYHSAPVLTVVTQQDLEKADRKAQLEEQRLENAEVDAFANAGKEEGDDPPEDAKTMRQSAQGESEKVSIQVGEKVDPLYNRLSELLEHLYGEGIDAFARDAQNDKTMTMMIDCSTEAEDLDWEVNIATTLCPFLRKDGPCGQFRHPSYQMESADKFCSNKCRPFVNAIIHALDHRGRLEVRSEATILRGVTNGLLLQYAAACRIGTYFMPN